MNIDPEDTTPLGQKLMDLYTRINDEVEKVLLESDWDDLQILNIIYGDALVYPVNEHIDRLFNDVPASGETVH